MAWLEPVGGWAEEWGHGLSWWKSGGGPLEPHRYPPCPICKTFLDTLLPQMMILKHFWKCLGSTAQEC